MNISSFHGLVGIRPDALYDIPRAEDPATTDYLYSSSSGLWVNSLAENLINLDNLRLSAREGEDIEQYLVRLYDGSVSEVINAYETYRTTNNQARTLLSSNQATPVIRGAGAYHHKITKAGRFVFLEITPKPYNTIQLSLQRLGFQFDSVQTDLPIYLYKSDQYDPVLQFTMSGNKVNSMSWFDSSTFDDDSEVFDDNGVLTLSNHDGERYYLGYYEDDLEGFAIKKSYPVSSSSRYWTGCGCTGDPYQTYNSYFSLRSGFVTAGNLEPTRKLFNIEDVSYEGINYGLNFKPFVKCSADSLYEEQSNIFAVALQHKYAIKILEGIWNSPNLNQATMSDTAKKAGFMAAELKDDLMGKYENGKLARVGLLHQINIDFSGLDKLCMPSRSKWSVGTLTR